MFAHRHLVILVLTCLLLPGLLPVAAGQPATTRTALFHEARLTAEIPDDWIPDRQQRADYVSPEGAGFIVTQAYPRYVTSLTEACFSLAAAFGAADNPASVITWLTVQGQIGCRLESPAMDAPTDPVGLVFRHPNPLRSGIDESLYFTYAGVMIDRAHFDEIAPTIDTSLAAMTPELYVDAAIDIAETQSLVRDDVDWPTLRGEALAAIAGDDPSPAIDVVLQALEDAGDTHSYRWDAAQFDTFVATDAADVPQWQLPTGIAVSDEIGYINLPPIQGDRSVYELYATAGNAAIGTVETPETCGWIIDLRANYGGNDDPMIGAVGELLGAGPFAGFIGSDGTVTMDAYADGAVYPVDGTPGESLIAGEIVRPANTDVTFAVLVSNTTGSSGELVAIAFNGLDGTQVFGMPSAGLTTGITGFILADGAALGLATRAMIDRNETAYPDGVVPDVEIPTDSAQVLDMEDPVVTAATDWLLAQPSCAET
jgi:hypothetical protein